MLLNNIEAPSVVFLVRDVVLGVVVVMQAPPFFVELFHDVR